ncbi:MAG: glycosyltransferase [Patescibacteria group bacterium]|jgi:hypothetical protein
MAVNYPKVDIIICSYRNKDLTAKCLDSLLNSIYTDYRIILVDDDSPDDSVAFFKQNYPTITIIENSINLGAALARNVGIDAGQAEYVVTMDNDASLSPAWLGQMVELMDADKTIGQAVGKILFADKPDIIAAAGGSMFFRGKGYDIGQGNDANDAKYNQPRNVLFACSAAMIVRREILQAVGGFYGGFFHGYEDVDLSLRINIAGYRVFYYPSATSYHLISATIADTIKRRHSTYLFMRNRLLIMLRNYELKSLVKYLPLNLRFNLRLCLDNRENIWPFILSHFSFIREIPNIIRARRLLNKIRTATDRQLESLFNLD